LLSIEDPQNPDVDVGILSFKISSAKNAFQEAFEKLSNFSTSESRSFVTQLIYYSYCSSDIRFRESVKSKYGENTTNYRPYYSTSKKFLPKPRKKSRKMEQDDQEFPPLGTPPQKTRKR
jgi:DNA polymerase sigma